MRSASLALLLAAVFALSASMTALAHYRYTVLDDRIIPAQVQVAEKIGFDVNGSMLRFGMVRPGGCGMRFVDVNHSYPFPVKVNVKGRGNMSNWITTQDILLEQGQQKRVTISVCPPDGTPYGNYSGEVRIRYVRAGMETISTGP
ncbi:hypothetical protein COY28_06435 [Candidatus Woesearchaeota archaeon CG_4_10_14_0_2_um_filter_57_5]|nr:MAG: hypothetical protein AUJ68_06500 [Candidatus Woesearchaeota archaeon CG1_02_57_44]PIZ49365.1 MAG: hypothetical protein COY28_06435 [Candidatus Woesearchaeota archaeon CG_4_10_14_0_2_um_filter_57_5]